MSKVYVYAPDADDLDGMGLCGALSFVEWTHEETKNGMSQFVGTHPIDASGRWKFLVEGYMLKADIPVRTIPEITSSGALVGTLEKWRVASDATKAQRYVYSKVSGGRKKKLLKPLDEVIVTQKPEGESRYKIKTGKTAGYIASAALVQVVTNIAQTDVTTIEEVAPAGTVRPQMFRVQRVDKSDTGVTVYADRIFYDLRGNLTRYSAESPTASEAVRGILDGCAAEHEFRGVTDMADTRQGVAWDMVNPVDALLGSDTGLVAQWGGELVRDDWEFAILRRAGLNRGVRVEYAKNLRGVTCETDAANVVTRIVPVGRTKKGENLLLAPGIYDVAYDRIIDGVVTAATKRVIVIDGVYWVTSEHASDYPVPHIMKLDLPDIKATGTSATALLDARKRMIAAALKKFENEGVDQPSVTLTVDFAALESTAEGARYKDLERLYLYDWVRVYVPRLGIDRLAQINYVQWDGAAGRAARVELDTPKSDLATRRVSRALMPTGMDARRYFGVGTVSAGLLATDVGQELQLSGDASFAVGTTAINGTDGVKVAQTDAGTYFQASDARFGLYKTADDTPIAEGGVDGDEGYFAATRIKDPAHPTDGYAATGIISPANGGGYELRLMLPNFDGVPWAGGVMTPAGYAPGLAIGVRNLPGTTDEVSGENAFAAWILPGSDGLLTFGRIAVSAAESSDAAFASGGAMPAGTCFSLTLTVAGWSGGTQTVAVDGLRADAVLVVAPAPGSKGAYDISGVYCSAQAEDSMTFTCAATPAEALTVNVLALGGLPDIGDVTEG